MKYLVILNDPPYGTAAQLQRPSSGEFTGKG
jgi:hypothetical protein